MPASQDVDFSWELIRNRHRVHLITIKLGATWGRGSRLQTWVGKVVAWNKFTDLFWAPPLLPAPDSAISPSLPLPSFSFAFSCSRLKPIEAWQLILALDLLLVKRLAYTFGQLMKSEYVLLKLNEGGLIRWKNYKKMFNFLNLLTALWSCKRNPCSGDINIEELVSKRPWYILPTLQGFREVNKHVRKYVCVEHNKLCRMQKYM